MPFEARIRDLSEQLANCRDEVKSLELVHELQTVLHEHVEQLRRQTNALRLLYPKHEKSKDTPKSDEPFDHLIVNGSRFRK